MSAASSNVPASRLALGTVQLGLNYGVSNEGGQVSLSSARQILLRASQVGIDLLDTAIAYGSSEQVLGSIGVGQFKIVSKLPAIPEGTHDVGAWILTSVDQSLARLKVDSLYGLLLHRSSVLAGEHAAATRLAFRQLKRAGKVIKTGVSIYGPEELDQLGALDDIDLVQSPLNIVDTRLVDSGWLDRLRHADIEVHVRSIFLQGLLLMPAAARPSYFRKWDDVWTVWERWLAEQQMTPIEAALRYVLSVDNIDRLIVGIESQVQLDQVASAEAMGGLSAKPIWPESIDASLLNPSLWKLQ